MKVLCAIAAISLTQGVAMAADRDSASADALSRIEIDATQVFVAKVADSQHRPKGDYCGKEDFEKSAHGTAEYLFYLFMPNSAKNSILVVRTAAGDMALPQPRPVYRMPDTPYHTYVAIDLDSIGSASLHVQGATAGHGVEISSLEDSLRVLPLRWNAQAMVSFQGLPKLLFASNGQ